MIIQEVLYQTILAGSTFSFICTDSPQAMSQNLWWEMFRELVNLHKHAVAFFLTDQTKIRKNQCLNKYQKDKSNARKDYIRHLLYIQKEAQQMEHVWLNSKKEHLWDWTQLNRLELFISHLWFTCQMEVFHFSTTSHYYHAIREIPSILQNFRYSSQMIISFKTILFLAKKNGKHTLEWWEK